MAAQCAFPQSRRFQQDHRRVAMHCAASLAGQCVAPPRLHSSHTLRTMPTPVWVACSASNSAALLAGVQQQALVQLLSDLHCQRHAPMQRAAFRCAVRGLALALSFPCRSRCRQGRPLRRPWREHVHSTTLHLPAHSHTPLHHQQLVPHSLAPTNNHDKLSTQNDFTTNRGLPTHTLGSRFRDESFDNYSVGIARRQGIPRSSPRPLRGARDFPWSSLRLLEAPGRSSSSSSPRAVVQSVYEQGGELARLPAKHPRDERLNQ